MSMRVKVQNFLLFLGLLASWHTIYAYFALYSPNRRSGAWNEVADIVKATSLGTLTVFLASMPFEISVVTPLFLFIFWLTSTLVSILVRFILGYLVMRVGARDINLRRVLIVGTNARALEFAERIQVRPDMGFRVIGFVDDEWPGIGQVRKRGLLVLASLAEVPGVLRSQVVDEVAIALPVKSLYGRISEIVALCEEQGIVVRFVREMFDSRLGRSQTEEFEDGPIMTFYTGGMHGWAVGVKRVIDVCCSLILLMMLSPLFLVVAVLIKILSPGPVFFVQERVGLNKRRFRMYKFRTMVADAEQKLSEVQHLNEVSGPVFKITNDPRLTSIGKYLRKTSIDELPQLISVLKGEMSLVGPRPLPERDFEGFDKDWQRRRLSVRPGITCLWQVNGRSDIAFDNWMKLDMEYIDQWSLWLDVKILAQTIPAVLRGVGAR
jgi:exopolysaccharide biosynthesis polyprenyl glycosylphosphotransferase